MATLTASLLAASLSFMPLKMVIIAMMEKKKKNFLCTTVSRKFSHWSTFGKISGLDGISDILYTSVDCDIHRILACLPWTAIKIFTTNPYKHNIKAVLLERNLWFEHILYKSLEHKNLPGMP